MRVCAYASIRIGFLILLGAVGCDRTPPAVSPAVVSSPTPGTLPILDVARDTAWQLLSDTTHGFTMWAPRQLGKFAFDSPGPRCMSRADRDSTTWSSDGYAVYFVSGSLDDALLGGYGFEHDSTGAYVSVGRQGMRQQMSVLRGTRWVGLSGSRFASVPLSDDPNESGIALDKIDVLIVAVRRPHNCWAVFDLSGFSESVPMTDVWRMLESVRFTGEDPARELPNQLFSSAHFDYATRVGVVLSDSMGTSCVALAHQIPSGTPVSLVEDFSNQQLTRGMAHPAQGACGRLKAQAIAPGLRYVYSLSGSTESGAGSSNEGIGVIGPSRLRVYGDTVRGDLDGDGIDEYFTSCRSGDITEYRIVSGAAQPRRVVWSGRVRNSDFASEPCS